MEQHNNPNQQIPQQQQTIIMVGSNQKSVGVAFLLAFLFGPLGLLYASVSGGIIMFILTLIIGIFTLGIGFILGWIGSIIWAIVAVNNHNQKAAASHLPFVQTQSTPSHLRKETASAPVSPQLHQTPEDTEQNWFYAENDQHAGPVSTNQLHEMFASKALPPQTLIWREGMITWTEAASHEQFTSIFAPVSIPTPPPLIPQKQPVVPPVLPPPPATESIQSLSAPSEEIEDVVAAESSPPPFTSVALATGAETVSQSYPREEYPAGSNFFEQYRTPLLITGALLFIACLAFFLLKGNLFDESKNEAILFESGQSSVEQVTGPTVIRSMVGNLRVRENPDLNAKVINVLKEGETAKYFGEKTAFTTKATLRDINYNEPWYKVLTSSGKQGWVYGGGIQIGVGNKEILFTAVINDPDGYTNIRKGPNTNSEIIGTVNVNQLFTVHATDGNWWQISTQDGTNGYMHKSRITAGKYPQASIRALQYDDISGKSKNELRLIRNEIFARHGFLFKSDDMRNHFENQAWYNGKHTDVSAQLSSIEIQNIQFLKQYED